GIANFRAKVLQRVFVAFVAGDIGEHCAIISGPQSAKMSFQGSGKRFTAGGLFQGRGVGIVGENLDTVLLQNRYLAWQNAASLVGVCQGPCLDFAGFNVGLIKWIDRHDGAGDGSCDLPAEEFLGKMMAVGEVDAHDRLACAFQRRYSVILTSVRLIRQPDVSEQSVRAISRRGSQRFIVYRDESLAVLAG